MILKIKNLILISTFSCLFLSTLQIALHAQNKTDDPSELLKQYLLSIPNEKYLINTDREIYLVNENIWYSIWSIDDITNIPVTRSKALYIELVGNDGNPLVQQTLLIENNIASGKILIPYTINSGMYYLRAYSNWQKNYGAEFFGIKILQIINPYNVPSSVDLTASELKITCFPEGGQIVEGIENKILIEVRNEHGNYTNHGLLHLTDQNDSIITRIRGLCKGIGILNFKPEGGKEYYLSDTIETSIPLQIMEKGINVGILSNSGTLRVLINGKTGSGAETLQLLARNSGNIFFEEKFTFRDTPIHFDFPEPSVPDGLTEFSILSGDNIPISQRLYYKKPEEKQLILNIIPERQVFSTREPIKIQISSPDFKKVNFLSMSIRRKELLLPSLLPDIYSDVLLHSYINDWDDFIQLELNISDGNIKDLINDYLISKSIKRYNWNSILSGSKMNINYFPETTVRYITGTAINLFTNDPLVRDKLIMYFVNQIPYVLMSNTDEQGRFRFSEPIKRISKQEVLIKSQKSDEGLSVKFDWPYFHEYLPYNLNSFYFDSLSFKTLDEAYQKWQINMIHRDRIEGIYEKTMSDQMSSLYGPPDRRFYLKDYIQFNNMFEVFKEIVDRVRVQRRDNNYLVNILDDQNNTIIGNNPLLLFNGHQIDNISTVMEIPVKNINFIDVITQRFFIGENQYDGLVNIVPNDVMVKAEVPRGSFRYVFDFINDEYDFRTRNYSEEKDNPLPDLRNTVYWNPEIKLNSSSEQIVFFAGDDKGEFELELKGIGISGELIYEKQTILIK